LIAGYDDNTGPSIYWLDYLATLHKVNTGGTGYGSYFALSLLDRLWRPDLTLDEAVGVMEKAIAEVKLRLAVAPSKFVIKVVDKDGVRELKRL
jgi:20S proteasome subunit beta 4